MTGWIQERNIMAKGGANWLSSQQAGNSIREEVARNQM